MIEGSESKRGFFKKMLAVTGLAVGANYAMKLATSRKTSNKEAQAKSEHEDDMQRKTWLRHEQVIMSDNEKKQMLDEILNLHNKHSA